MSNEDSILQFNKSSQRSGLNVSQDYSQMEDSFLSSYRGRNLDVSDVSFYGSNRELSVKHSSCLNQSMNEDGYVMLNNYVLMNQIGRGSFAKVVKAKHIKSGKYFVRSHVRAYTLGHQNSKEKQNEAEDFPEHRHKKRVRCPD